MHSHNSSRRRLALAGITAALGWPAITTAQIFPAKPITLILPFPAGGVSDTQLRALAEAAAKDLVGRTG